MQELQVFQYNKTPMEFEVINGEVFANATLMCQHFVKRPNDFLNLASTKRYLEAITKKNGSENLGESVTKKIGNGNLIEIRQGGVNQGTWIHEKLILKLSQWLDVDFEIWCDERIAELLRTGKVEINQKIPSYTIKDEIERAKAWIVEAEERELLQEINEKLQFRSDFVDVCFDTDGMFSMEETVKILKLPFGRNDMMKQLRDKKILTLSNTPTQKNISNGYFKVVESLVENGNFKKLISTTYATQKGVGYIHKLFSNDSLLAIGN